MKAGAAWGLAAALVATPAAAHTGAGGTSGFVEGLLHPLLGPDHLLAMVAVGLWAGLVGGRALWAWPATFVLAMALGAGLAFSGLDMPGVEAGIAASVVAFGLAVALRVSPPVAVGVAACAAFALFHGHAHGAELPDGAGAGGYVAGFGLATAALHAAGVGLGSAAARIGTAWLPRVVGGAVAALGLAFLAG